MSELETLHFPLSTKSLPEGWELVRVQQIAAEIQTGFASGQHNSDGRGIQHLRPMNITADGKLDFSDGRFIDPTTNPLRLKKGDVLFNNTNSPAWVGKTALIDSENELAFSNHMTRLRMQIGIDSRFTAMQLHFVCRSGYFQHQCKKHVNQASINRDFLAEATPFFLPPATEQKRIADKLDVLLSRVDSCRERLDRVPAILRRFRQSVLAAATSGKLTEDWREENRLAMEWGESTLGKIGVVSGGLTKNAKRKLLSLQKPYLRVANVYANELRLDDVSSIGLSKDEFERTKLEPNDLLIVEGNGSVDQIGRAAIWDGSIPHCCHQNHLIRWRSDGSFLPSLALYWLMSPKGRNSLVSVAQSTTGLHTLSITKVSNVPVDVPPLKEQIEIVRRVKELLSLADALEGRYRAGFQLIERLTPALLAKAFRGELVPQDPNDEPASELLKRIQAKREAQFTPKKKAVKQKATL